ncbi:MAG: cupin domain-containing protein [Ruminococcaceae bacterium]|nr:cupin domain-containing protein [Oscillospiraceae bacterium]
MTTNTAKEQLMEIASRIKEMRDIMGWSIEEMAEKTEVTVEDYNAYENANADIPFSFIHKCAIAFDIEMTELLEGGSARLSGYTVTRKGMGQSTAKEDGIDIKNLAPKFKDKIAEPYWVRYEYDASQQNKPIHLTTHSGQEFDLIMSGSLKVQIGNKVEILNEGDSIYYNSSTPHGMIAIGGKDCVFCAVVLPGEDSKEENVRKSIASTKPSETLVCEKFVDTTENENGELLDIKFKNTDTFNFGFDIVDGIAGKYPDKLAMLHVDKNKVERRFTFNDIKRASNQVANYFTSLGIKKGDKVMLVLKRHYQFWFCMVALHKIGAIAIPATNQLKEHDFEYRFNAAGVSALVCTADGDTAEIAERAAQNCPTVKNLIMVGDSREGWRNFDDEYPLYSAHFYRNEDTSCGEDLALMFFTSGTTGNPKMAAHKHTYALGHFVTAKYWHCCERDGLHLTISDTGWGKSLWGKLYGQWLCEGAVFVYDFDKFVADEILPMFAKYQITTFCAPPTMLRLLVKGDLSKYDLSSINHMTTAGEALNPEVFVQFEKATGLQIMEGFGQTETTLTIANLCGTVPKVGAMGKASPQYNIDIVDSEGNSVADGEVGEIVVRTKEGVPCGLFKEYYMDEEKTNEAWYDGMYHTGDTAWRDEEGYFWYVSRIDDVIKSSGYRIGPFEIESVIMELPYVLECGVSAAPDEVRGQVVKASVVLVKGTEPTEELKKEIQQYVKEHTAPYKYPRIVVFKDELPKTISGKIQRNKL